MYIQLGKWNYKANTNVSMMSMQIYFHFSLFNFFNAAMLVEERHKQEIYVIPKSEVYQLAQGWCQEFSDGVPQPSPNATPEIAVTILN